MSSVSAGESAAGMATIDHLTAPGAVSTEMMPSKRPPRSIDGERDPFQGAELVCTTPRSTQASQTMARLLQGQEKEWAAVAKKEGPLQLLDLPVVILKMIVREITSTNDLTSLSLTHSALHDVTIPVIYSRFDIVWPDSLAVSDTRTGVDALTYGLATLVMAGDVFGESPSQQPVNHSFHKCTHCGHVDLCQHYTKQSQSARRFRRGNNFAQYTRKFSLGNGPADWVQEYLITKEGGKMLGTLVALAIGRMRNLEQFVWDMPTGVLRDVWAALASLGDRDDNQPCRLEKIWVRWHNNQDAQGDAPSSNLNSMNPTLLPAVSPGGHPQSLFQIPPYPRVEFPTFSRLSPLKSLTVLDIDELSYVEEMSVLLERSRQPLRELRIGVAHYAQTQPWVTISDDKADISQPSGTLHGILGILLAKVVDSVEAEGRASFNLDFSTQSPSANDCVYDSPTPQQRNNPTQDQGLIQALFKASIASLHSLPEATDTPTSDTNVLNIASSLSKTKIEDATGEANDLAQEESEDAHDSMTPLPSSCDRRRRASSPTECERRYARNSAKLHLDVLALERVPLSVTALSRSINWTKLTSLTILRCSHHESLWKALRKKFAPTAPFFSESTGAKSRTTQYSHSKSSTSSRSSIPLENYPLQLKRLQTDAVSSQLISFIKEALAPDTLEWLFLQEGRPYRSSVTVDSIYRGAIRRHRASLRKLLIDSEDRNDDGRPISNNHWRRWLLNREILTFITSGKMPNLRELGMSMEYKDWHFFLRRLPNAPQLRSLYIPYVADHVHGSGQDSKELALQVLDIVFLQPQVELCYLGIQTKCFEILELSGNESIYPASSEGQSAVSGHAESDSEDNEEADDPDHMAPPHAMQASLDDSEPEMSDDESADESDRKKGKHFKLREILFYDDKISIFKARHGRI